MYQINMPKRVDEGSSGALGGVGSFLGKLSPVAAVIPGGQPFAAGMAALGAVDGLTSRQGSVSEGPSVQNSGNGAAMARRLLESSSLPPLQVAPPPMMGAMQRRGF